MKSLMIRHFACLTLAGLATLIGATSASAQVLNQQPAGVEINPDGVLSVVRTDKQITRERIDAARAELGGDLATPSDLRKVSLNRLEMAIAERLAAGEPLTDAMKSMAGLTAVRYVFFYPETGDIVLAGPAEGFVEDATGRVVGINTGAPTVLLEDVVTALRAYPPKARGTSVITVSIDPTEEGLRRLNDALSKAAASMRPGAEANLTAFLAESLGMHTVSIRGVPETTHFAQVLVEADYRMKLIGIGLERVPFGMKSYSERSASTSGGASAMERWYFQPNYECVTVSEDGLGMGLQGNAVKLVGAAEMVNAKGERQARARGNRASQEFCSDFTENYDRIAAAIPVYAQLRNMIDISIAAAFIQRQDYATQAGWDMSLLMDESRLPVETHTAPKQVATAVNAIWKGRTLLTPLGGGVSLQPKKALSDDVVRKDDAGLLVKPRQDVTPPAAVSQWWWD